MKAAYLAFPPGTTPQNVRLMMPQCEAPRVSVYLSDRAGTSKQCHHSAKFSVGGKNLCTRHAEIAALAHLMGVTDGSVTP